MVKKKTKDIETEDNNLKEEDEEIVTNPIKNTMSDKTRYMIIGITTCLLFGLVIFLAIVGDKDTKKSGNYYSDNSNTSNSNINNSNVSNQSGKKERDTSTKALKNFYEAFDSKELKVIFFARTSCGYCNLQKPILETIAKDYDMDYYAIDTDKLENNEVTEIMSALNIGGSTPTTVIVKDGKIVDTNVGYLDGKPYVEFFVKNGVLKKDSIYKPEDKLVSIDYSEFKKLSEKKEKSLILLDSSACSSCIIVRSTLNKLATDNNFKVNYLTEKGLTTSEINSLIETDFKNMEFDDETYKEKGQISIPLLLVVKDNKILDYVIGSTEESDYTKVLKKHKFIK